MFDMRLGVEVMGQVFQLLLFQVLGSLGHLWSFNEGLGSNEV